MKILIVALATSIHTVRWINQLIGQGWDIHLFPSEDLGTAHPEMNHVTVHHSFYWGPDVPNDTVKLTGFNLLSKRLTRAAERVMQEIRPEYRVKQLARLVDRLKPDLIHSMEMQGAGYLTLEARKYVSSSFPRWIVTNWGSDIYLFGRLRDHRSKIEELLKSCDYYSCESERDVILARRYGFTGIILSVLPNSGGFDLSHIQTLRQRTVRPSIRREIMLKGYQGWAGRALVGLRALERCADVLVGYTIRIFSPDRDVVLAAELMAERSGLDIKIIPRGTSHEQILAYHGASRISLGLSISDGISTSLLEAMVMGSFPIQSNTSSADEWIKHGRSGFIVPAEDPEIIEQAIRTSLADGDLVDQASEENWQTATCRLDHTIIRTSVIGTYRTILGVGNGD